LVRRLSTPFLAQTESLGVRGTLRDLQQGTAVDRRHFDFGTEGRLPDRDRYGDFNVVAFATEERMRFHFGSDVKIAGRGAHRAGIAFAGDAQAGTIARARGCGSPHLGVGDAPSPPQVGQALRSLPDPPHFGQVRLNFMGAGHLADVSRTLALRAGDFTGAGGAGTVAGLADIVAVDVDARLGA
jgi:hypothetical protein